MRDPFIQELASIISDDGKLVFVFGAIGLLMMWPWIGGV